MYPTRRVWSAHARHQAAVSGADPVRRDGGAVPRDALAEEIGCLIAVLSRHLAMTRDDGLVGVRRDGKRHIDTLTDAGRAMRGAVEAPVSRWRSQRLNHRIPPERASRIAERLEVHHTPRHGSWRNVAEIELSVLARKCLDRRIETKDELEREVAAWEKERNERGVEVRWRFTTADARIKLRRLYPVL
jgi:DNA-binding transcriptional ArsR family regulator